MSEIEDSSRRIILPDTPPKQQPVISRRRLLGLGMGGFMSAIIAACNFPQADIRDIHPKVTEHPELAGFQWTRNEILFAPDAGFKKARDGSALLVYPDPSLDTNTIKIGEEYWNSIAESLGRSQPLFTITQNRSEADVSIIVNPEQGGAWTQPEPSYQEPFTSCSIFILPNTDHHALSHELGHSLGIVDWVDPPTIHNPRLVNPQLGNDPNKPISSIMSAYTYNDYYDDPQNWSGGKDDGKLLILAGYVK